MRCALCMRVGTGVTQSIVSVVRFVCVCVCVCCFLNAELKAETIVALLCLLLASCSSQLDCLEKDAALQRNRVMFPIFFCNKKADQDRHHQIHNKAQPSPNSRSLPAKLQNFRKMRRLITCQKSCDVICGQRFCQVIAQLQNSLSRGCQGSRA